MNKQLILAIGSMALAACSPTGFPCEVSPYNPSCMGHEDEDHASTISRDVGQEPSSEPESTAPNEPEAPSDDGGKGKCNGR